MRKELIKKIKIKNEILSLFLAPILYPNLFWYRNYTAEQLISKFVVNPQVKEIIWVLALFSTPSKMSGVFYSLCLSRISEHGIFYPTLKSKGICDTISDRIRENNGKILCNHTVSKIEVENNKVKEVIDSKGRSFPADLVVSNISPNSLYTLIQPPANFPKSYLSKLEKCKLSLSAFIVWVGLNKSISPDIKSHSIMIKSGQTAEEGYEQCVHGSIEENYTVMLTIYDNIFQGYSKPGKTTLSIVALTNFSQ